MVIGSSFLGNDQRFHRWWRTRRLRAKRKIPARVILRSSPKALERKKMGQEELRQVKIIKSKIFFNSLVWLWRDKVAFITLKENLFVVVIESRELSETIRAMFETIWNCHCPNTEEA